ncbi:peptidoglycan-binding domain-containing protein [Oceaniglobus roseus]|uniref:peptidoglycan-binding domain-containing protein n=1 Tax=Oceaniglobus roseus TaxID=1737570 RepID=UPI000C7EA6B7|nr:peptidoglycan-binding domain-containing protein [Kandeliimicrobium roseum]
MSKTRTARATCALWLPALLAGCVASAPDVARFVEPQIAPAEAAEATGDAATGCFDTVTIPAVVETRTEHILAAPDASSAAAEADAPARYETVTETRILQDRREIVLQTVCAHEQTPAFIASLQRALQVRGHYTGAVTGEMDAATRAAVRRYQGQQGLNASALSLAGAKRLGLAVYTEEEAIEG